MQVARGGKIAGMVILAASVLAVGVGMLVFRHDSSDNRQPEITLKPAPTYVPATTPTTTSPSAEPTPTLSSPIQSSPAQSSSAPKTRTATARTRETVTITPAAPSTVDDDRDDDRDDASEPPEADDDQND